MSTWTRTGLVVALCLLAPGSFRGADASPPAIAASLELKDGRVLHHVKVMSAEAAGIVVNADEGLIKIERADLPQAFSDEYLPKPAEQAGSVVVMPPFNPNLAPEGQVPAPGPKPVPKPSPKPTPRPTPGKHLVYKGCSIISFEMKPFQNVLGGAEVVIRNDTDAAVVLHPGDLVCTTKTGSRRPGRNFIAIQVLPPVIRRREIVPPNDSIVDIVTFTNDALDISSVDWSR